ncbi:MAG: TonB-dependent receptor plug domain-containing protein [Luteimonas sp.]
MTFKTTKLRDAISFALVTSTVALVGTGVAYAQDTAPADATNLDRIEVTGSRIRQVDTETAQPVLLISRKEIEKQGFNSVADILQNTTSAGSPAISRTAPLTSGESVGGTYIDLRSLGPNRTLVLVNGKRLGQTNQGFQDVASIPAVAVERIEILKDGASTIYGSDAIAGVINIITRKNFDGAEANAYIGQYGQGDGQRQQYDFLMGFTGDRGSLTAGVEYTKEDPVYAPNRWFSRDASPVGDKSAPRPGGDSGTRKEGQFSYNGIDYTLRRDIQGLDPALFSSYRPIDAAIDLTFPQQQSTVYSGIERKSVFLNGHYEISDKIAFDTDVLYTDRESFARNAGYPFRSADFPQTAVQEDANGNIIGGLDADSYFNPVGENVDFRRRGWEQPREVFNSVTTFRWTAAFSGSFELGEGKFWDWDIGSLYNQNKGTQISTGNFNKLAVARATGPSFLNADGVVQCGTAANPITLGVGGGSCTPWNPLIPFGYDSPNSLGDPNVRQYLLPVGQAVSETETRNYFANISGTIATLPAGDLGFAAGIEHRQESGTFSPDSLSQTGDSTDLGQGPTGGQYSLDEVYAELQVPLLADLPGAQELSVNLASRYSDYDTFGDTINSKFGFKWKPLESLLIRGTWAEGFRAPTISDLYGGGSQSFSFYADPCDSTHGVAAGSARCLQDVPANFRQLANTADGLSEGPTDQSDRAFDTGSNPGLTPETSKSKTLGVVWSPSFAEGLNITLDWWNVRIENTIVGDTETGVLADCYVRGIESRCSDPTGSRFTRDENGVITSFRTTNINAGFVETEGYDLDFSYAMDTDYGRFSLAWLNSYVSKNEIKIDNNQSTPPSQQNGFASLTGIVFRLRSNATLGWEQGDWGVSWTARYYSGFKEACNFPLDRCDLPNYTAPDFLGTITPQDEIGANTFHDVQIRYNTPWNATVAVGANNVFEHYAAPAYSTPASGYAYYGGFDIGRFVYFKYQQRF